MSKEGSYDWADSSPQRKAMKPDYKRRQPTKSNSSSESSPSALFSQSTLSTPSSIAAHSTWQQAKMGRVFVSVPPAPAPRTFVSVSSPRYIIGALSQKNPTRSPESRVESHSPAAPHSNHSPYHPSQSLLKASLSLASRNSQLAGRNAQLTVEYSKLQAEVSHLRATILKLNREKLSMPLISPSFTPQAKILKIDKYSQTNITLYLDEEEVDERQSATEKSKSSKSGKASSKLGVTRLVTREGKIIIDSSALEQQLLEPLSITPLRSSLRKDESPTVLSTDSPIKKEVSLSTPLRSSRSNKSSSSINSFHNSNSNGKALMESPVIDRVSRMLSTNVQHEEPNVQEVQMSPTQSPKILSKATFSRITSRCSTQPPSFQQLFQSKNTRESTMREMTNKRAPALNSPSFAYASDTSREKVNVRCLYRLKEGSSRIEEEDKYEARTRPNLKINAEMIEISSPDKFADLLSGPHSNLQMQFEQQIPLSLSSSSYPAIMAEDLAANRDSAAPMKKLPPTISNNRRQVSGASQFFNLL